MSPEMFARSIENAISQVSVHTIVFLGLPGIVSKHCGRRAKIKLVNVHMQHNGGALTVYMYSTELHGQLSVHRVCVHTEWTAWHTNAPWYMYTLQG